MVFIVTLAVLLSAFNYAVADCNELQHFSNIKRSIQQLVDLCLFPSDYQFMKRVAYVESRYGCDLHNIINGGVWQMTAAQVTLLRYVSRIIANDVLAQLHVNINDINYVRGDLKNVTTAAIAFRSLFTVFGTIPADLNSQARLWATYYKSNSTLAQYFIDTVDNMQEVCSSYAGDIIFILDSSGSIGYSDFNKVKLFVDAFINSSQVKIGENKLEVGIVDFSDYASIVTQLQDYKNKSALQQFLQNHPIDNMNGLTNMYDGLLKAFNVSQNSRNYNNGAIKNPFPQVAILITDGYPNEGAIDPVAATRNASQRLKDANVELYTVGVSGANQEFLTNISSPSGCAHYFPLTDYNALAEGFVSELLSKTCFLRAILDPKGGVIHIVLLQNETRYYSIVANVSEGLTIKISSSNGSWVLFISKTDPNPSAYSYDLKTEENGADLGQIYLSPSYLSNSKNDTVVVYIAIEGLQETNNITMSYDVGYTVETTTPKVPTAPPTIAPTCAQILSECLMRPNDINKCISTGQCSNIFNTVQRYARCAKDFFDCVFVKNANYAN